MPSVDVSTCADAIRDILEALDYPVGSGDNIGRVYTRPVLLWSEKQFKDSFIVGNPTVTVWLVLWGPTAGNWVDTPASTIQRNHTWMVRGYKPMVDSETDYFYWTDLCDHVHRQLNKESNTALGLSVAPTIRVGPWSATDRENKDPFGVACFSVLYEAPMENDPEVV